MPDLLSTLFTVSGHQSVISATNAVASAQKNLADITKRNNIQDWAAAKVSAEGVAAAKAVTSAKLQEATALTHAAAMNVIAITAVTAAAIASTKELERYGNAVMNIQHLTGASAGDSARAENLFRVSGVGDSQQMRDILRLGRSAFSSQGQYALSQLGISSNGNNGLDLFNQIADKLGGMKDGLRKTSIEEELFGIRGVAALQPLLRLTKQQRDETMALADNFDTRMLPSIQNFGAEMSIAGQAILQKFIFPMAQTLMPVLLSTTQYLADLANAFKVVNDFTGGTLGAILELGGAALIILKIVQSVKMLSAAIEILNAALEITDALTLNWGAIAGVAAVVIGGGIAYNAATNAGAGPGGGVNPLDQNTSALDRNTDALAKLGDSFPSISGRGIPSGLSTTDISTIYRSGMIGAIG